MAKSIAIVGTVDTKGDALQYLKHVIEGRGHQATIVDVGILGDVPFKPAISRDEIAQAAGSSIAEIIGLHDENRAIEVMAKGAAIVIRELHWRGEISGVLAIGGSMGTALGLKLMRQLPLGVPKLILSTVAYSRLISPDLADSDTMMMPWVAGLWGLNRLSERALGTAAAAIAGAADHSTSSQHGSRSKTVAVTSLGMSINRYIGRLKPALEERGYAVAVFQSTGMSTRLMERAISDGEIDVVLDLCVGTELVAQITGGANAAGAERLTAAAVRGLPQIVSPGGLEIFHWEPGVELPLKYQSRPRHHHNCLLDVILSSVEERAEAGRILAAKLNASTGPAAVVIPMRGLRSQEVLQEQTADAQAASDPFFAGIMNPEAGVDAFLQALRSNLRKDIKIVVLDAGVNDPVFVDRILDLFDTMTGRRSNVAAPQR